MNRKPYTTYLTESPCSLHVRWAMPWQAKAANHGVTLVELLVATTIFITLMSSIVLLFSGTVRTMRSATMSMEVHDVGRSTFDVLERDVYAGFAARERGVDFSFYGAPFGFMVVRADSEGRLSRVTYVLHPDADSEQFDSTLTEPWGVVFNRVRAQARQMALEEGMDAEAFVDQVSQLFDNFYPAPVDSTGTPDPTIPYEFPVRMETWSLVRYEEDLDDLHSFELPEGMEWPYIDPVNPNLDRNVTQNPETENGLYNELLIAANMIRDVTSQGSDAFRVLRPAMTQTVIQAKRRELWLRILQGESTELGVDPFWDYDDPTRNFPDRPNVNEYVLAEGILRRAQLLDPNTNQPLVVTLNGEQIPLDAYNVRGIFRYGIGDQQGGIGQKMVPYFNALQNIRTPGFDFAYEEGFELTDETNYAQMVQEYELNTLTTDDLINFDAILARQSSQSRTAPHLVGSPLFPRMPHLVEVSFYMARERAAGGGQTDFRRHFSRVVEIPTGAGRDLPMNIIPKPGMS